MIRMSKETEFRYYEASSTMPSAVNRPSVTRTISMDGLPAGEVDRPTTNAAITVHLPSGAGNKCVAPVQSRPKRRQTICSNDDDDTLDVKTVHWTTDTVTVSQLAAKYQTSCPLLVKVIDSSADFTRGQVYLL